VVLQRYCFQTSCTVWPMGARGSSTPMINSLWEFSYAQQRAVPYCRLVVQYDHVVCTASSVCGAAGNVARLSGQPSGT
jgi:hypothetical protein